MKTKTHRKRFSKLCRAAIAVSVAALVALPLFTRAPLPKWEGKSLAELFRRVVLNEYSIWGAGQAYPDAEPAIIELGGDAVPFLLSKARQHESKLAQFYDEARAALPARIARGLPESPNWSVGLERSLALNLLAQILDNGTNTTSGRKALSHSQVTNLVQLLADARQTNEVESAHS